MNTAQYNYLLNKGIIIMKIALSISGQTLQSPLDINFGRAKSFMLYDTDSKTFDIVLNNQNLNSVHGAGIHAAQNIVELGTECLITAHCGSKAIKVLNESNVKVFHGIPGTSKENIDSFLAGNLIQTKSADVKGHWI